MKQDTIPPSLESNPRWRRYASDVHRILVSFDNVTEWADVIGFLSRLSKTIQGNSNFQYLPHNLMLGRRLAQCLSPALPPGVHQRVLETYRVIFEVIGRDGMEREHAIFSMGLFPFFRGCSTSLKTTALALLRNYYYNMDRGLQVCFPELIASFLPWLEEENGEHYDEAFSFLRSCATKMGEALVVESLWNAVLHFPRVRLSAVQVLNRWIPNLVRQEDLAIILGYGEPSLAATAMAAALCGSSPHNLVERGVLDLLINKFPLSFQIFNATDAQQLMFRALFVVNKRDLSLNKRLSEWMLGPKSQRPGFFEKHVKEILIAAIKDFCDTANAQQVDAFIKCLTSLSEIEELVEAIWRLCWSDLMSVMTLTKYPSKSAAYADALATLLGSMVPSVCWTPVLEKFRHLDLSTDISEILTNAKAVVHNFPHINSESIRPYVRALKAIVLHCCVKAHALPSRSERATRMHHLLEFFVQSNAVVNEKTLPQEFDLSQIDITVTSLEDNSFSDSLLPPQRSSHYIDKALLKTWTASHYLLRQVLQETADSPSDEGLSSFMRTISTVWIQCTQDILQSGSLDGLSELKFLDTKLRPLALQLTRRGVQDKNFLLVEACMSTLTTELNGQEISVLLDALSEENAKELVLTLWAFMDTERSFLHRRITQLVWNAVFSMHSDAVVTSIVQTVVGSDCMMNATLRFTSFWKVSGETIHSKGSHILFTKVVLFLLEGLATRDPAVQLGAQRFVNSDPTRLWRVLDPLLLVLLKPDTDSIVVESAQIEYVLQCLESLLKDSGAYVFARIRNCKTTQILVDNLPSEFDDQSRRVFISNYAGALLACVVIWLEGKSNHANDFARNKCQCAAARCLQLILNESNLLEASDEADKHSREYIQQKVLAVLSENLSLSGAVLHPLLFDILKTLIHGKPSFVRNEPDSMGNLLSLGSERRGGHVGAGKVTSLGAMLQVVLADSAPSIMVENWLNFSVSIMPLLLSRSPDLMFPLLKTMQERIRGIQDFLEVQFIERKSSRCAASNTKEGESFTFPETTISSYYIFSVLVGLKTLILFGIKEENTPDEDEVARHKRQSAGIQQVLEHVGHLVWPDRGKDVVHGEEMTLDHRELIEAPFILWTSCEQLMQGLLGSADDALTLSQLDFLEQVSRSVRDVLLLLFKKRPHRMLDACIAIWSKGVHRDALEQLIDGFEENNVATIVRRNLEVVRWKTFGVKTIPISSDSLELANFLLVVTKKLARSSTSEIAFLVKSFTLFARELLPIMHSHKRMLPVLCQVYNTLMCIAMATNFDGITISIKENLDVYRKFIEGTITVVTKAGHKQSWKLSGENGSSSGSENDELISKSLEAFCDTICPSLFKEFRDQDLVNNICSGLSSVIAFPLLRQHGESSPIHSQAVAILSHLSQYDASLRQWKREAWDYFTDIRFFDQRPEDVGLWIPVLNRIFEVEVERFMDISAKIAAAQGGLFTSRTQEILNRCVNIRRLSLIIISDDKGRFTAKVPAVLAKLVESIDEATISELREILLCMRVIVYTTRTSDNAYLFPLILYELIKVLRPFATEVPESEQYTADELAKIQLVHQFFDFVAALKIDSIEIHNWVFFGDKPVDSLPVLGGGLFPSITHKILGSMSKQAAENVSEAQLQCSFPEKLTLPYLAFLDANVTPEDVAVRLIAFKRFNSEYAKHFDFPSDSAFKSYLLTQITQPLQSSLKSSSRSGISTPEALHVSGNEIMLELKDGRTLSTSLNSMPSGTPSEESDLAG